MRKAPTIQTHGRDPRKSKVPTTLPCPWTLSRMEGKLDGWSHQFLQNDCYASSTKMPPLFHVFLMAGSHIGSSHVMILPPAHPCTVFSQWACLIAPLLAEIKTLLLVRTQHEMHSGRVRSWGSRGFLVHSQGISMLPKALPSPLFPRYIWDKDHHTVSGTPWAKHSTGLRKGDGREWRKWSLPCGTFVSKSSPKSPEAQSKGTTLVYHWGACIKRSGLTDMVVIHF